MEASISYFKRSKSNTKYHPRSYLLNLIYLIGVLERLQLIGDSIYLQLWGFFCLFLFLFFCFVLFFAYKHIYFSQFWSLGSPRSEHWQIFCLVRAGFLVHSWLSSPRVLIRQKGVNVLSGISFMMTLIPFMRAPPSWPICLPKSPPSNTIILGIGLQHKKLGRGTQIIILSHLGNVVVTGASKVAHGITIASQQRVCSNPGEASGRRWQVAPIISTHTPLT